MAVDLWVRGGSRRIILVVDDDPQLLQGLDSLLAACGHFTVAASGVLEAIQILQCTPVDLVLSDVDLPGGSGHDVARCAHVNGIPVVLMSGTAGPEEARPAGGADRILQKPFPVRSLLAAVDELLPAGDTPAQGPQWEAALEELVRLIGQRDRYTYEHSCRVQRRAVLLARAAALSEEQVHVVAVSALLHDIGLIAVPGSILTKPGRLEADERERIREHPLVGEILLRKAGFPAAVLAAVRSHHERWDGKADGPFAGYPDQLAGKDIPIESRLLGVTITYDALLTPRAFRRRLTSAQAIAELHRQAGHQCDPQLVARYAELVTHPHF